MASFALLGHSIVEKGQQGHLDAPVRTPCFCPVVLFLRGLFSLCFVLFFICCFRSSYIESSKRHRASVKTLRASSWPSAANNSRRRRFSLMPQRFSLGYSPSLQLNRRGGRAYPAYYPAQYHPLFLHHQMPAFSCPSVAFHRQYLNSRDTLTALQLNSYGSKRTRAHNLMTMCVSTLCRPATRISNAAGAYISAESSCGGVPYNKQFSCPDLDSLNLRIGSAASDGIINAGDEGRCYCFDRRRV
jgi:hypothetical protein